MKRCSIIFHSVCGNNYIIASAFRDSLQEQGLDARLYRVDDPDLHIWANKLEISNEFYEDILALPEAKSETLLKSDLIILGSPTYFANMSAEMKQFIDYSSIYFDDGKLTGKYFACFTSCSHPIGGGTLCLQSMIHYAQHMGLNHIPLGRQVDHIDEKQPVSGILHCSGRESSIRPSDKLGAAIDFYAKILADTIGT
ncbi:MAG: flavodoxin family protein [Spirochaetota bacterium]